MSDSTAPGAPDPARRRRLQLGGGVVLLALAIVAVLILVSQKDDAKPKPVPAGPTGGPSPAAALFAGVPQRGNELGRPDAPVTLEEFADLQCPYCREYSETVMPSLVKEYVRAGKVRMVFHDFTILGHDSVRAGRFAAGAAAPGRFWPFVAAFYGNQGQENTGYVTDDFLRELAAQVPGLDFDRALSFAKGPAAGAPLDAATRLAQRYRVTSTPTIFLSSRGGTPQRLDFTSFDVAQFRAAIERLLRR
jgi:protein-disulfide isomerase